VAKGRPRSFDREDALRWAMMVFWKHGYDATSVALLTDAMGIAAPSMYAAFGDKRALFEEALQHYAQTYGAFTMRALSDPDARVAVERLLLGAAEEFTSPDHPPGCMLITAATNCAPESASVQTTVSLRATSSLVEPESLAQTGASLTAVTVMLTKTVFCVCQSPILLIRMHPEHRA